MMRNLLFWRKIEAGKRWRVFDHENKLRGFVRFSFDGWDGYVITGRKWPNAEKQTNLDRMENRSRVRSFWNARRSVEYAIAQGDPRFKL